ncbi:GNAT family N-acetyltransferase [Isobaculum melis]|uniref:N-acetyltransferase domain-containing protein n=1 Tax=Isobaculum melis TaxID=142588 RepID=A0A1H9THG8_9LACT|nr:GNAT family N-acetyltransferase [Isobaculum melis]SER96642.1 hypothetical protein SAMN04488559_11379 [Isobaculum melis]
MNKQIQIAQATLQDQVAIHELLFQAASWLKSIGSKQWNGFLEGKDNHHTSEAIARGEVFICRVNQVPAGMFILWSKKSQWDQILWQEINEPSAFYLHRLAIDRKFAGQHLSEKMLSWAKVYTRSQDKEVLRLDCLAENIHLNQLYQINEFQLVGCLKEHDAGEQVADFNLYEWYA